MPNTPALHLILRAAAAIASLTTAVGADEALSPFGIGACNQTSQELEKWIPQMEEIGVRRMRTCRVMWVGVEPVEGKWDWTGVDREMKYLGDHHFAFGGLLLSSPGWNKKDQPGSLPVNNIEGWSRYVSESVKHCKDRIKYWEVWNEPPNFTGKDQTPADYAKIVVASYDAAKAADPNALVGLAAKSSHVNYLEQVIKARAKGHYDYIVLHPYEVLNGVADNAGTEAVYMNIVPVVRKMLAAQDPAKVKVPVIFTELQAVVAYGGSARAGSVPGGNVFIVDPGFLSYTTTPIEITAVVRRNEANDNAGFNLNYESTTGLKGGPGWYTVPDNKKWHSVTWKIKDAQFVNYWTFNFSFNSDGDTYNKYYIQSVTVTKTGN